MIDPFLVHQQLVPPGDSGQPRLQSNQGKQKGHLCRCPLKAIKKHIFTDVLFS